MATDTREDAHELVDQLGPGQFAAVVHPPEVMSDDSSARTRTSDMKTESQFRFGRVIAS